MAEEQKNQLGDGSDNYAGAAKQMANAAKEASKTAAKTAASEGAKATANAAAATVKAGIEGGKAVAEIATGTAAGGPLGAVIAAAWSMRHTPVSYTHLDVYKRQDIGRDMLTLS